MTKFEQLLSALTKTCQVKPELSGREAIVEIKAAAVARKLTYGELENLITSAEISFEQQGVKAKDMVLLCCPNSAELVAAILATWRKGIIACPVDWRLTTQEVENVASKLGVSCVFTNKDIADKFKRIDPASIASVAKSQNPTTNVHKVSPDDEALVILTSGTTGFPKAAVHTIGSLMFNIDEVRETAGIDEHTRIVVPLPLTHITGLATLLSVILAGGTVLFEDFVPQTFLRAQKLYKPTMLIGVPTIFGALLHPTFNAGDFSEFDCFFCGGAPLPVTLADDFSNKFGKRIIQGYGATEAKIVTINRNGPTESIGLPLPSTKVEIVDAEDNVLADGEQGEIRVTSPMLMNEYYKQSNETQEVLHDGHYHTGDIGYIKDGYVYISGRSKEMIIVAGNKVFPNEVETVLRQHPESKEVAVIGVPHTKLGQIVKAIVVVAPGTLSERLDQGDDPRKQARQELLSSFRDFCAKNLKRELRPMDWDFRSSANHLPKTLSGKIDKKQLS